jgi:acyl-CoA thioesterase FadM
MGHVNNAVYLDWLDEAIDLVEPAAIRAVPRRYRLEYRAAASPGATLVGWAWGDASGWSYRLTDAAGRLCLGGRLEDGTAV